MGHSKGTAHTNYVASSLDEACGIEDFSNPHYRSFDDFGSMKSASIPLRCMRGYDHHDESRSAFAT